MSTPPPLASKKGFSAPVTSGKVEGAVKVGTAAKKTAAPSKVAAANKAPTPKVTSAKKSTPRPKKTTPSDPDVGYKSHKAVRIECYI